VCCGTGVRKGVCRRILEFVAKGFPFCEKGGEVHSLCHVDGSDIIIVWQVDNNGVVVVIVKWVNNGGGVSVCKLTGRDFT